MSPGYGFYQLPTVRLRMSPQMRQAIRILQLSTPELLDVVRQELYDNPVLEPVGGNWNSRAAPDRLYDPLQHAAVDAPTLERHLMEQLNCTKCIPPAIRRIILYMIGNLDAGGYLEQSLDEIAVSLHVSLLQAEQALGILQGFEPTGVGARSLKECLLLQVRRNKPECTPLVPLLIEGHLEDIAAYRIRKLAAALQAAPSDIQAAIDVIKSLNPRPCSDFQMDGNRPVIPDVIVEPIGDQVAVTLQDVASPRLAINRRYRQLLHEGGATHRSRKLWVERFRSASFFIRCLEQRRQTLQRVTQAIMEVQVDFVREGPSRLKTMTLKQIGDIVNLHESTVSRATAGKYAQTPWGVYELSYFFPSGVNREWGNEASSERIKARIKEWIRQEDVRKPYSDQRLTELLLDEGIPLSRRTVAKYREELAIPSSAKRKRL